MTPVPTQPGSTPPVVLSIAGTDSGGAAGLAADLTTFAALGAHGACAVTAVTAQDTTGVHEVVPMTSGAVEAQVAAVLDDLPVAAIKTGMLGSAEVARSVAAVARTAGVPFVVDPVLVASSGFPLATEEVVEAYRAELVPAATVVTPNRAEAAALAGRPLVRSVDEAVEAAWALHVLGPAVVVTGGDPAGARCVDVLLVDGAVHLLDHGAVATRNDHGTGCTFSAALAVALAHGAPLPEAVRGAQRFVARALRASAGWQLGRSRGPVAHTFPISQDDPHPQES